MALHIEQIADDIITYLREKLPAQLAAVTTATDSKLTLPAPRKESYFIGEPSRFRAYQSPSVFVITDRTNRPEPGSESEWNTVQRQDHVVFVDVLMESRTEEILTRMCWRAAEAFDAVLDQADISIAPTLTTPAGTQRDWSTKTFVTGIDYGVMFTSEHPDQRIFRKDIVLELLVQHWDLLTPRG